MIVQNIGNDPYFSMIPDFGRHLAFILFLVDGKWGKWGKWSGCPVTCGGGTQKRTRTCNKPKPAGGGKKCQGDKEMTRECNSMSCGREWLTAF